jgi:hypothetical protein
MESFKSSTTTEKLLIPLDRELRQLEVGDLVRFVMAGFYLPREQENFGKIERIDQWGGIHIKLATPYRHFTSTKSVGAVSNQIYFVHHRYDSEAKARIYSINNQGHELFISKADP